MTKAKEINLNTNWQNKAEIRKKNKGWFRYAYKISLRIQSAIKEKENFTQSDLAALLNVTPQYISKVIKGQENLSLETIYKISKGLGVELISFPDFKYSMPINAVEVPQNIHPDFRKVIFSGIVEEGTASSTEYYTIYECKYKEV